MSEEGHVHANAELLSEAISEAFPDVIFSGSITDADGMQDEDLEEPRALYYALHGRKWSEVEPSVISSFPDGIVLLTDLAFVAFLPAWLLAAVKDEKIRELLVHSFSPDTHKEAKGWNPRIEKLNLPQRTAFVSFLSYCLALESSEVKKSNIRSALAFAEHLL